MWARDLNNFNEIRVREAKTGSFVVKDHWGWCNGPFLTFFALIL